jgi:hypothetical protein
MLTKKSIGVALACALAVGAFSGSAFANPVEVDGVHFDTDAPTHLTVDAVNFRESSVSNPGDVLHGYGNIATFDGNNAHDGANPFCPNCDLTFTFEYTLQSATKGGEGSTKAVFTDGSINFFVGAKNSYDQGNPDSASAGTPWLTLTGHKYKANGYGDVGELYATVNGPVSRPQSQSNGAGLLDATGGDAQQYFDFNAFADGFGHMADITFNSSFNTKPYGDCGAGGSGVCNFPISGTGELIGNPQAMAVPEPAELGLFGLGLGALGVFFLRRRKEADNAA